MAYRFASIASVTVHDARAYRNMNMTRERISFIFVPKDMGWSDGAMVLGKLSVPGRPTNLD